MNTFVFHINAQQRASTVMKALNNHVNKMTYLRMSASPTLKLAQGPMCEVAVVAGTEALHRLNYMDVPSPRLM